MNELGVLAIALAFGGLAFYSVRTGRAAAKRPWDVRRDRHPIVFWFVVLMYAGLALVGAWWLTAPYFLR